MLPPSFDATTVPVPSPEKAECVKYCIRFNREYPHSEGGDCPKNFVCMMEGLQEYQKKKTVWSLTIAFMTPT